MAELTFVDGDGASGHRTTNAEPGAPFDWLSRDDAEVDKYIADPLCGDGNPLSYSYAVEVLQAVSTISEPDGIAAIAEGLAVLLVTGETNRDEVTGHLIAWIDDVAPR